MKLSKNYLVNTHSNSRYMNGSCYGIGDLPLTRQWHVELMPCLIDVNIMTFKWVVTLNIILMAVLLTTKLT